MHAGEFVALVREPRNPYDGNAVRVDTLGGTQVGHITRKHAPGLAPLMDDRSRLAPRFEASIPREATNQFMMPVELVRFGRDWLVARDAMLFLAHHHFLC